MDKLITRISGAKARHSHIRAMGLLFSTSANTIRIDNSNACSHIPCSGEWNVVDTSAAVIQTAIVRRMIREMTTFFGESSRIENKERYPVCFRTIDDIITGILYLVTSAFDKAHCIQSRSASVDPIDRMGA